jgi:hypothetical protein
MLQGRHTLKQKTVDDVCCHLPLLFSAVGSAAGRGGSAMHGQFAEDSDVIPFARSRDGAAPAANDQLDKAGQTILQLVAQAAGMADENSRHALGMAQKLSDQLQAAEAHVAELEAELSASRERADRAEQWLHRIYGEIEERFLQQSDSRRPTSGAPRRPQNSPRSR